MKCKCTVQHFTNEALTETFTPLQQSLTFLHYKDTSQVCLKQAKDSLSLIKYLSYTKVIHIQVYHINIKGLTIKKFKSLNI